MAFVRALDILILASIFGGLLMYQAHEALAKPTVRARALSLLVTAMCAVYAWDVLKIAFAGLRALAEVP